MKHQEGYVILLDFWATWCPPCQKPMAHNVEMIKSHGAAWEKVKIIGLSIDDSVATIASHVAAKGWEAVHHCWTGAPGCTASDDWGITSVPHCVLVDTTGTIVWKGHPASINLEEAINKLLKGEKL